MKPRLLVVELWGIGDLAIATPFLRAASAAYDVTLLAKPYAEDLRQRFWPSVNVVPVVAPWTAFKGKYRVLVWPWWPMIRIWWRLRKARFEAGLSARWDPRDHILLALVGVRQRYGYPRMGSRVLLTEALARPSPTAHRYEHWQVLASALGLGVPPSGLRPLPRATEGGILVHSGAAQLVRVWPLERYRNLVKRLRAERHAVQVACDPDQRDWWLRAGEAAVVTPASVGELLAALDRVAVFIGNDSGPGHVAAVCGVPTFTLFGPQLPEWFAPLHPAAEWIEGKACPYKPCSDYCRFSEPYCMTRLGEEEVWSRVQAFAARHADRRV